MHPAQMPKDIWTYLCPIDPFPASPYDFNNASSPRELWLNHPDIPETARNGIGGASRKRETGRFCFGGNPRLEFPSALTRLKSTAPSARKSHNSLRGFEAFSLKLKQFVLPKDKQVGAAFFIFKIIDTHHYQTKIPDCLTAIRDKFFPLLP